MKRIKRTISILMCAALLLGLLPTVALAEEPATPTDTADFTAVDTDEALAAMLTLLGGSSVAEWDRGTTTLILKGVDFTTIAATALKLPAGSTIVLVGENTITSAREEAVQSSSYGIYADGDLTIQGDGTLTATGGTAGLYNSSFGIYSSEGSITIESGTVTTKGGTSNGNSCGIYAYDDVIIKGGTVAALGGEADYESYGICAYNVTISGGTVTAMGDEAYNSYGIYADENVKISGETVTAMGDEAQYKSCGIYAYEGSVTIENGEVNAEGGAATGDSGIGLLTYGIDSYSTEYSYSYGIYADDDVTIKGGTVTATGGEADDESYGIYADYGSVKIENGEVKAEGGAADYSCGIYAGGDYVTGQYANGNVTISGGTVTATGGTANYSCGIEAYLGSVTIEDGKVNATGGMTTGEDSYSGGIDAYAGSVTIEDGEVKAEGGEADFSCGIYAYYDVDISDNADVTAEGGAADEYSEGIEADNVTISGGIVEATGGAAPYSCGIYAYIEVDISGGTVIAKVTPADPSDDTVALLATATSPTVSALNVAPAALPDAYYWRISDGGEYAVYPGSAYEWEAAHTYVEIRDTEPTPDPGPGPDPVPPVIPIVTTYPVTAAQPENGAVTVSPANAAVGVTVTVTVTPDAGYELASLTVTDAGGKELTLTDKGDGKYTFTMPAGKVSVNAAFSRVVLPFTDVPADAYYYDAVAWAVENKITEGTGDGTTFSPNAPCTRGQIVTFLWRAAGCPEPESSVNPFTDVEEDAYYFKAMLWAVENGITIGTGDGTTFSPDAVCTRDQAVTFLWRAVEKPAASAGQSFTDVPADAYYASAVQWAVANGVTIGSGDGTTFSPADDCTRAQIITFLYRTYAK